MRNNYKKLIKKYFDERQKSFNSNLSTFIKMKRQ